MTALDGLSAPAHLMEGGAFIEPGTCIPGIYHKHCIIAGDGFWKAPSRMRMPPSTCNVRQEILIPAARYRVKKGVWPPSQCTAGFMDISVIEVLFLLVPAVLMHIFIAHRAEALSGSNILAERFAATLTDCDVFVAAGRA